MDESFLLASSGNSGGLTVIYVSPASLLVCQAVLNLLINQDVLCLMSLAFPLTLSSMRLSFPSCCSACGVFRMNVKTNLVD